MNLRFKNPFRTLWQQLRRILKRFSRLPEEDTVSEEPIDFSAPSTPYYAKLSEGFNLARIVLYMILFAFVVVTVLSSRHLITYENLYYLVKDVSAATLTAQSEADYLSYPISDADADFALYRGGLTIAGGQEITVLSGSGKQTLSENVSLARPCVRTGDEYLLVFSRGEAGFSVYNAFVRLRKEATEFPVFDACMSKDGSFAILTRSLDYTSEVILYNNDMNKQAAAHIGGYVTALTISDDGKTLAILSLELQEDAYVTKLTLLRKGLSAVTHKEVFLRDTVVLSADFLADDRLAVVCEDKLLIFRSDGDEVANVSYPGSSPRLCTFGNGQTALLCSDRNSLVSGILSVYDKNGKELYSTSLASVETAEELLLSEKHVYIRMGEHILCISNEGNKRTQAVIHRDTLTLLAEGNGDLLACGPAFAQRIKEGDFTPVP